MRKLQINQTSRFRGVSYSYYQASWKAQIMLNYRNLHLGYFSTEEKAKEAYDTIKELVKEGFEISTGLEARKLLVAKGIKED